MTRRGESRPGANRMPGFVVPLLVVLFPFVVLLAIFVVIMVVVVEPIKSSRDSAGASHLSGSAAMTLIRRMSCSISRSAS